MNGNAQNPAVFGVQGILDAYKQVVPTVKLWGPTKFSEILNWTNQFVGQTSQSAIPQFKNLLEQQKTNKNIYPPWNFAMEYTVLLIITDGVIDDMDETIQQIVKASALPMSVIIVGVGGADFKNMETLDGDNGQALKSKISGQTSLRDIVQFRNLFLFFVQNFIKILQKNISDLCRSESLQANHSNTWLLKHLRRFQRSLLNS